MSKKYWISSLFLLFVLALVALVQPVSASPQPQVVYQTPTPLADGRIIYIVQEKDSCLRIQLLTGVTVQQLQELNGLDQNCSLSVGKELLLGVVTPVPTITPNPDFTATPLLPTPTPPKGSGLVCIQLYNDINGDGFQEDNEVLLSGGAVSITDNSGQVSETGETTTDTENPFCKEVPEGDYSVSMAVPDGYNATTQTTLLIPVIAGNQGFVDFGAQVSARVESASNTSEQPPADPQQPQSGNNLMLALLGGLLLILGLVLGAYVLIMRR